jgi:hypothetical protein
MHATPPGGNDRPRRGLGRGTKPFRIEQLPDDVLRRYEREVLADPRTLAKDAQAWLAKEGHPVSLAAVLRHRRRLAQAVEREGRARALGAAIGELASAYGVTDEDFATAHAIRSRHLLLARLSEAYSTVSRSRRPAPPEEILAFAKAVRMYVG